MRIPLAACALLAAACTAMPPAHESAASLIAAERAFSAQSVATDMRTAFLASAAAPALTLGYFLRLWRRTPGGWRIALDITNPVRPR